MLFTDYIYYKEYYSWLERKIAQGQSNKFVPVKSWKSFRQGNNYIIFAPLIGRLFLLSKQEFDDFRRGRERAGFRKERLFIPEDVDLEPQQYRDFFQVEGLHHVFITTNLDCNMNCKYCFTKQHQGKKKISWEFIKTFLDTYPKDAQVMISFAPGGEPTLAMNIIKKTFEYATKKFENPLFDCSTNGSLPLKDLKWLVDKKISVHISFDGLPEIQNEYRPFNNNKPSYPIIKKRLEFLSKRKIDFVTKVVVSPANIALLNETVWQLHKMGVKKIMFNPLYSSEAVLRNKLKALKYDLFVKEHAKIREISELMNDMLITNSLGIRRGITDQQCSHRITLNPDNSISACSRIIKNDNGPLICGAFDAKNKKLVLDNRKINRLLNRTIYSVNKCSLCWLRFTCGAGCPEQNYVDNKNIYSPATDFCTTAKKFHELQIYHLVKNKIIQNRPVLCFEKNDVVMRLDYQDLKLKKDTMDTSTDGILLMLKDNNLASLEKKIINVKSDKPFLFLFDFCFQKPDLILGNKLKVLFDRLTEKNCWFMVLKPLPKCLFEDYDAVANKFKLPTDCMNCLRLVYLDAKGRPCVCKRLAFKKNKENKEENKAARIKSEKALKDYYEGNMPRTEFMRLLQKSIPKTCCESSSCIYLIKNACCNSL